MTRRVVVTGMGMISPLGHTVETTWAAIVAGKSGIGHITRFDPSNFNVRIAAEVKDWEPTRYIDPKQVRRTDAYQQFIHIAAKEAVAHSGIQVTDENRLRTSVIIGSSVGGVSSYYHQAMEIFETGDPRRITPFGIPMFIVNGGSDDPYATLNYTQGIAADWGSEPVNVGAAGISTAPAG
jgi:3-oxoacyl-[acyl-carrier-protein] synthase II